MFFSSNVHHCPQKRLTWIRALVGKQPGRLRSSLACKDLGRLSKPWERSTNITNIGGDVGHFSISNLNKNEGKMAKGSHKWTDHVPLAKVQIPTNPTDLHFWRWTLQNKALFLQSKQGGPMWVLYRYMWPFEKFRPQVQVEGTQPFVHVTPPTEAMMDVFGGHKCFSSSKKHCFFCEYSLWYKSIAVEKTHVFVSVCRQTYLHRTKNGPGRTKFDPGSKNLELCWDDAGSWRFEATSFVSFLQWLGNPSKSTWWLNLPPFFEKEKRAKVK